VQKAYYASPNAVEEYGKLQSVQRRVFVVSYITAERSVGIFSKTCFKVNSNTLLNVEAADINKPMTLPRALFLRFYQRSHRLVSNIQYEPWSLFHELWQSEWVKPVK